MKRFIARFIVALLTFSTGVTLTMPWLANRQALPVTVVVAQSEAELNPLECAVRVARSDNREYVLAEIAVRYAQLGQLDRALPLINTVEDEEERVVGIAQIAATLWKSGQRAQASELNASLEVFKNVEGRAVPKYSTYTTGRLAEELAASWQYGKVFKMVAIETDNYLIRAGLDAIVENYEIEPNSRKESEVLSEVVRLSKRMTNGEDGRVVQGVAVKYAAAGQMNRAVRLAESLTGTEESVVRNFDRDDTLQQISFMLADAGQYDRAVRLAEGTDDFFRELTLIEIAGRLNKAGRHDQALAILAGVTPPLLKKINVEDDIPGFEVERLAQTAVEYARAGRADRAAALLGRALKAAREVGKAGEHDGAMYRVAVSYAETGLYDEAIEVALSSDYPYSKVKALTDTALEMVRAGHDEKVERVVRDIQNLSLGEREEMKAEGLLTIAGEYLTAGQRDAAMNLLSASFEIARGAKVNEFQPATMQNIAVKYAEAGEYDRAFEVVREIRSTFYKAFALADTGVLQAQRGHQLSLYSKRLLNEMAGAAQTGNIPARSGV